jgi:tetratricopeptide (TPR) repeat protein
MSGTVDAVALHLQAVDAAKVGKVDQAIDLLQRSLKMDTNRADAWADLRTLLVSQNRHLEAVECIRQLARIHPSDARLVAQLSNALLTVRDFVAAEIEARRAIAIDAKNVAGHINLGVALHHQGRLDEAVAAYRSALELAPNSALASSNLSDALAHLGRLEEAEAAARRAVEIEPNRQGFWMNWTSTLMRLDRPEEALEASQRAVALDPADYRAHVNAGMALLTIGRWGEGLAELEHRMAEIARPPRAKVWDGSPLNGRTILLRGEQGFGDTIQFVRYAPLVRERWGAGRVVLECRKPLAEVMKTAAGVDQVIDETDAMPADVAAEVFVMSLPHRLGTTVENVPADVPYLSVDEARVAKVRGLVRDAGKRRVGLVWAGNPQQTDDRRRSSSIEALRPLTQMEGVEFYSLQKGPAAERDAKQMAEMGMIDLGGACEDFADLAAAMSMLDLVISVCTAPAHLAGALGIKVWTMLPWVSDWRWLRGRTDSPWYPTMRLFRQPRYGDWESVVQQIVDELHRVDLRRT